MKNKVSLGDIAHIYSGGTPSRTNPEYWRGNIPWVKTTLIQNCIIKPNDVDEWITEEGFKKSSAKLVPEGSILMAMIGQGKTRGQVAVLDFEATTNQNAAAIVLKPNNDSSFVYQQLLFRYKAIRNISNASGQQNLNLEIIRTIKLPEIGYPEQKAIAGVLSTWDRAISTTERLIQAKEKRFKWLMRTLINPNEKSGWKTVKLGELFGKDLVVEKGRPLIKKNTQAGNIPVVAGGQTYAYYHNEATHQDACITISASGAYAGFIWFHNYPIWASDCNVIYSKKGSTLFFYYALKSLQHRIFALQAGGAQPHVYAKDMKNLIIPVPEPDEQKAIAKTLNTVQREIALLKKLSEKYKEQKRGLMQKLLTGIWRVQASEVSK